MRAWGPLSRPLGHPTIPQDGKETAAQGNVKLLNPELNAPDSHGTTFTKKCMAT